MSVSHLSVAARPGKVGNDCCPPDPLTPLLLESIVRQLDQVIALGAVAAHERRLSEMLLYVATLADRVRGEAEESLLSGIFCSSTDQSQ